MCRDGYQISGQEYNFVKIVTVTRDRADRRYRYAGYRRVVNSVTRDGDGRTKICSSKKRKKMEGGTDLG